MALKKAGSKCEKTMFRCLRCAGDPEADGFDPEKGLFTLKTSPKVNRKGQCPKCGEKVRIQIV
jgi:DNA-directed RNA polymerase subunit RPC12/RpoP